jgi:hypothetical protein
VPSWLRPNQGCPASWLLGLGIAYFEESYFKDDVRGLVQHLESMTAASDIIVVHPSDHAVGYYYDGPSSIAMVDPENEQDTDVLVQTMRGRPRAFVAWPFGVPVGRTGQLPFRMEMSGMLVDRVLFRGYHLSTYDLLEPADPVVLQPRSASFRVVQLTGGYHQTGAEAGGAVCLALRWELAQATDTAYKATIILWDETGRIASATDMLLTNRWGQSTDWWTVGEEVLNYYVLPVPLGTPPLPHRITVGLYDGANMRRLSFLDEVGNPTGVDFPLGDVHLTRARDSERDPYATRTTFRLEELDAPELASGLALEGFAVTDNTTTQMLNVTLRWKALRGGLPRLVPLLRLRGEGTAKTVVAHRLFEDSYPTTAWAQGEVIYEQRDLAYPHGGGRAVLEIELDGRIVPLTEMVLDTARHSFVVPPMQYPLAVRFADLVELLGYDLDATETTAGEMVALTLYWKPINDEPVAASYTVFAHLLNEDGRLIGQHDGIPSGAARPSMTWVNGEIITDKHEMQFTDPSYVGQATVEVGLYQSQTIARVMTEDGGDHVILPTEIRVKPAQQ